MSMSLSAGYLTSKQKLIWNLKNTGLQEASIARQLKVTRQTIHKALNTANSKVYTSLEETARINKIRIEKIDPSQGILVGYSTHFKTAALVTFSARNGVQIWYKHEGDCRNCEQLQTCRESLLAEARDRNVPLPKDPAATLPSEFAKTLFTKLTGEGA
jgi:transcriptional regulator